MLYFETYFGLQLLIYSVGSITSNSLETSYWKSLPLYKIDSRETKSNGGKMGHFQFPIPLSDDITPSLVVEIEVIIINNWKYHTYNLPINNFEIFSSKSLLWTWTTKYILTRIFYFSMAKLREIDLILNLQPEFLFPILWLSLICIFFLILFQWQ